ncbi:hypothetical protein [Streptantibioticus ferralitis]|uniref:Uncharacterized protein n=1 Tax=Streptantibioticus ferralitis TaxID=236510 RepID=A0ABT5YXH6_9ACTN|nr:hypothetical protein [Streptantibioticus ferralitis]MDF2256250.1 hypothetical protein [Streptantibioticus ferralitis]
MRRRAADHAERRGTAAHAVSERAGVRLLPLVFSTYSLPPLPIPYLSLTGVEAKGVWMTAVRITAREGTLGTARLCTVPN